MKENFADILLNNKTDLCHCYIDIDNFREFNIKNSFEFGNIKLKELEELIKIKITPSYLIRIESDEFYFSFPVSFETHKEKLFHLLQIIENQLGFTVSIGVTERNNILPEELIKTLKHNTTIAKIYGKNKLFIE